MAINKVHIIIRRLLQDLVAMLYAGFGKYNLEPPDRP